MKNVVFFCTLHAAAAAGGMLLALAAPAHAAPNLFTLVTARPKMMTAAALAAAQHAGTPGQISADKKTLAFSQKSIHLVAVTGPDRDMLSYRIEGLRNPTLILPRGATLHVLFVNTDDDMAHDLRFGKAKKSYPSVMTADLPHSIGTTPLPHKTEKALTGEELTLRVPKMPGTCAYFCTVPGHAQGGMTGRIIVR